MSVGVSLFLEMTPKLEPKPRSRQILNRPLRDLTGRFGTFLGNDVSIMQETVKWRFLVFWVLCSRFQDDMHKLSDFLASHQTQTALAPKESDDGSLAVPVQSGFGNQSA
jgi:hypothetical protein